MVIQLVNWAVLTVAEWSAVGLLVEGLHGKCTVPQVV